MFDICEVPSGSLLDADGSITTPDGGVVRCSDYCSPTQYALTCYGPEPGAISSPAPSLGCTVIPIPTPSGELFYCCPCS